MDRLSIWQQNVNKSRVCQHDLMSNNILIRKGINFVALQEPALSGTGLTIASRDWTPVYPSDHGKNPLKTRSVLFIRADMITENWNQLDFPSSDVTVVQLTGQWGKITIFNIDNDGESDETVKLLTTFHRRNQAALEQAEVGEAHIIWLGNFNRHHPYWDNPEDSRLFTNEAMEAVEKLIEAIADAGLDLALPTRIPTHEHSVTKRWSRLNQVFLSEHSNVLLTTCNTQPEARGINTDHLPILTELSLEVAVRVPGTVLNFREVNWEKFRSELKKQLDETPAGEYPKPKAVGQKMCRTNGSLTGSSTHRGSNNRNHAEIQEMVDEGIITAPYACQQSRENFIQTQKSPRTSGARGA